MGMFDMVRVGDRDDQFKLWNCDLSTYTLGDMVDPDLKYGEDYDVKAEWAGGYVQVHGGRIMGWSNHHRQGVPLLDKWGGYLEYEGPAGRIEEL